jgi:starch-binding outer membrane protein, SusD/RagB family
MKKINLIFIALTLLLFAGCSKSFLDSQDLTKKNSDNYPATPTEANEALTGVYNIVPSFGGINSPIIISEIMSDDRFGGGGQNDRDPQAMEYFRVKIPNEYSTPWAQCYKGIFRANSLLSSLDKVTWGASGKRASVFGQASFLRAYFYFDLARMFGLVPLVITPAPANNPKATAEELFGQIALDLKNAIDSLDATPISASWKTNNMGRVTKWAAEGYMARVFLFYTGYYQKTEIALPGGGSITKAQVINWVDDVVANSGASLVPEFRNMWPYSINEATNYKFAQDNGLNWVTDAGNTEAIFEISYVGLATSDWGTNNFYNNTVNLFCGHRDADAKRPFGHGWGFAPVNPNFYTSWSDLDLRKKGSVWNQTDAAEGTDEYVFGADMQWHETKLMEKKYIPINIDYNGKNVNYSVKLYGSQNDIQLDNTQNMVLLRLADVLLMGAELGSSHAQAYMDDVRNRVGLPSVPPTLDNIKDERHHELAFEGVRYFDLLRWYGKEAGAVIQANEKDATIYNMTVPTTINASDNGLWSGIAQRVRDTGGFLMIPDDQITLSGGVLTQNPGWTNSGDIYY